MSYGLDDLEEKDLTLQIDEDIKRQIKEYYNESLSNVTRDGMVFKITIPDPDPPPPPPGERLSWFTKDTELKKSIFVPDGLPEGKEESRTLPWVFHDDEQTRLMPLKCMMRGYNASNNPSDYKDARWSHPGFDDSQVNTAFEREDGTENGVPYAIWTIEINTTTAAPGKKWATCEFQQGDFPLSIDLNFLIFGRVSKESLGNGTSLMSYGLDDLEEKDLTLQIEDDIKRQIKENYDSTSSNVTRNGMIFTITVPPPETPIALIISLVLIILMVLVCVCFIGYRKWAKKRKDSKEVVEDHEEGSLSKHKAVEVETEKLIPENSNSSEKQMNGLTLRETNNLNDPKKRYEAGKIKDDWRHISHKPEVSEVKKAALLAWEGYLTSVENMIIKNMDITDIPRAQMEKLTSIVTKWIWIEDITHTIQLSSILASVRCERLQMSNVELSEKDTWAPFWVIAMEDWVEVVWLDNVTLNIEDLCQYGGRGKCRQLTVCGKNESYPRLRSWVAQEKWELTLDNEAMLMMEKKQKQLQPP